MLRRSICRRGPKGFADFTTPATDQCVLLEWYNESLAPRVRKGTAGQTEPREWLTMGKGKFKKGISDENDNESKRRIPVLLSILCAGLVTIFLGGCAEGPYVTAYDRGYYPAGYYTGYSYYDAYPS